MKTISFLIGIILTTSCIAQEVPVTSKQLNWVVPETVVLTANDILDSVGCVLRIDSAVVMNDSVISLIGHTTDNNKRATERMIVKRNNDTLWTTPDVYVAAQYFSCTENDCCTLCSKGATSCICQSTACTKGTCEERTYGNNYPSGGLSNAIRNYLSNK